MPGDLLEATVELAQLALAHGAMKAAKEHDHHEALGRLFGKPVGVAISERHGWMVVPEFQGRDIAVAATAQAIELARRDDKHRFMHAFPKVDNAPSNAICRKLGFELLEAQGRRALTTAGPGLSA